MINLNNNYICGLDIGSSKIAAVAAEIKKKRINSIFFETAQVKGVKCGQIVDSVELVGCLTRVLKNLKIKSGINIRYVHANISGKPVFTKYSKAIIPLAEMGNKVITNFDIDRVNREARVLGSSLDEEIIHSIPLRYAIDSKPNIENPLGLYSHKLEVDLYLICAGTANVQSLSRAVSQAGYEIKTLSLSSLALAKFILPKQGLNIFCDIGADITEILIFRDGILSDIEVLPIGAGMLTTQLQDALNIPFELAESLKRSHGAISAVNASEDKEVLVRKNTDYMPVKQKVISEVTASSARALCFKIKDSLRNKIGSSRVDNFIAGGRAILLEGFIETLENALEATVSPVRISDPVLASVEQSVYLTALGMIYEALEDKKPPRLSGLPGVSKNPLVSVINRFREVYQEYF